MTVTDKTYQPLQSVSIFTSQDIPAHRFISYSGVLAQADTRALGVSETRLSAQAWCAAVTLGTALIEINGNCQPGDDITSDSAGKGKKAVNAGSPVNGRALDAVSGGGIIRIKLVP